MTREILEDSFVERDGTITKRNRRFASLSAELMKIMARFFTRNTLTAYGGSYPANLDEHDATYDPGLVLLRHLSEEGFTRAEIAAVDPIIMSSLKFFMDIAINSHIFGHQKPPGMPSDDANREEPII